jgi:putative flippase GtrA
MITRWGPTIQQFIVFAGVGGVATAAQYVVLIVSVEVAGIHPVLASTAGRVIGILTNYALSYAITFRSKASHLKALSKFLSLAAIGLCINWLIMAAGTSWLGLHYLATQVISTVLLLFFNYVVSRVWVFR